MMVARYPDAIDTRLVLRVYAWSAFVGGLSAFVITAQAGRDWLRLGTGEAATLGIAGSISWAFSSYAAALSRVDDPANRVAGLKEFAVAHLVIGVFLMTLDDAMGTGARMLAAQPVLATNLLIAAAALFYVGFTASPGPRSTATLRSLRRDEEGRERAVALREREGHASMRRLRSQYDEQIRQAARQEERARLARDLHDAVKQQLFVIQTAAATVQARVATDLSGAKKALEQVRTAAREAMTEMEAMLDQLQAAPIENTGLVEALKKQCEALGFRTGAQISVDIRPLAAKELLPPGAQEAIFRVAQEALANVGRHARARHVTVRLEPRGRHFVLDIVDDGAGFDPVSGTNGMGIKNMQARAGDVGGRFELASGLGAGTTVTLAVPLAGRTAFSYLLLALVCALAVGGGSFLIARSAGGLRAIWIAATWIALIAAARYLVAAWRVHRRSGANA